MAVLTASTLAALVADPRGRAALTHLLTVPPDAAHDAATTLIHMMQPAQVLIVKEAGAKPSKAASRPEVEDMAALIAKLRTEVLHHPSPVPAQPGTAQWNAVAKLTEHLSKWREQYSYLSAWQQDLANALRSWMTGLKDRRMKFSHSLLNNDDQLSAIEEHFVSLKRLADFPRPWQEMRKAWCNSVGVPVGTCNTMAHRLDCLSACERLLEAVEVEEGDAAWVSACEAWVDCHLGAAKEAGGASTWAAQRGWLSSPNAVDRMLAFLSGAPARQETVDLTNKLKRF